MDPIVRVMNVTKGLKCTQGDLLRIPCSNGPLTAEPLTRRPTQTMVAVLLLHAGDQVKYLRDGVKTKVP